MPTTVHVESFLHYIFHRSNRSLTGVHDPFQLVLYVCSLLFSCRIIKLLCTWVCVVDKCGLLEALQNNLVLVKLFRLHRIQVAVKSTLCTLDDYRHC